MNNHLRALAILLFTTIIGDTALAQVAYRDNITDAEYGLLPRYCPYTQSLKHFTSISAPSFKRWERVMGSAFNHMHHYCWAHVALLRSERALTPQNKKMEYRFAALNDFYYVIRNSPADFSLLPEIYTWVGRTEILVKHEDKAQDAFFKAQSIKPDYWPAYSHWAEYLHANGDKSGALDVVINGLQHSPKSSVLRELLRILGGKPEDIPTSSIKRGGAAVVQNKSITKSSENSSTPPHSDE